MIVLDTSAIMAILHHEEMGDACYEAIAGAPNILMSAGTMTETLIVSGRQDVGEQARQLLDGLGLDIVPVTLQSARQAAAAYAQWGKGVHPARLNLGDCFAYALAKERAVPLLFVGNDFAQTDIEGVL